MVKCSHCGAGNSDSAKFCGKCAVRLRPPSSTNAKKISAAPSTEADIETITRHEPLEWHESELPALSRVVHDGPDGQAKAASSAVLGQPERRTRTPLVVGMVAAGFVVALSGAAITWWSAGARRDEVPPPVAVLYATPSAPVVPAAPGSVVVSDSATASVAAVPPPIITAPPAPAVLNALSTPADGDKKATRELSTKTDKAKTHSEAVSKRKTGNGTTRKADVAATTQGDDAIRIREATSRINKDELTQLTKRKPTMLTPQQACADRSNFISRGICESRECEKPERANLKFCVDMRERRVIHD